jgi:DNA-binding beta-propeller fold protein YncE
MNVGRLMGRLAVLAVLAFQLPACATKVVDTNRYFWPALPDVPRVEWLGAYASDTDLKPGGFMDAITGNEHQIALDRPVYISADGAGKVFVSDQKAGGIMQFDLNAKKVEMVGGAEGGMLFGRISGVALDGEGNIYGGDIPNRKIVVFTKDHKVKTVLDLSKDLKNIGSFAIDRVRKRIIIPDVWDHKIAVFNLEGKLLNSIGKRGNGDGEFNYPTSVALDPEGTIVVCDSMNARIQRFSPDLKFISKFGKRGDGIGEFNIIKAAAVDSEGHIYVTDGKGHKVSIFNEQGEILLSIGAGFSVQPGLSVTPGGFLLPQGIYIDQNDTIYVVDQMNSRIQIFQYLTEKYLKEHPLPGDKKPGA